MRTILDTPRLALREMTPGDLDFVAAMLADPEVMRFYPKTCTRDEAEGWLRRQFARYERHGHGLWLVEAKADGRPVGQVGLALQRVEGADELEVGYLIHRPYWRLGYATEAATAARDHAFGPMGRSRLISLIRPENVPSQGVARKLGMAPEPRDVFFGGFTHLVFAIERRRSEESRDADRPGPDHEDAGPRRAP